MTICLTNVSLVDRKNVVTHAERQFICYANRGERVGATGLSLALIAPNIAAKGIKKTTTMYDKTMLRIFNFCSMIF